MSNKMCNDCWLSMQNCHDKSICCEMDEYDGEQCDWFEPMHIVHGHWDVHEDTYGDDEAKCSVCGFEMAVNQPGNGLCMVSELNYCPHCGAKMDLLDDDTKWEVTDRGAKVTKHNCTKEEIEEVKAIMEEKVTE